MTHPQQSALQNRLLSRLSERDFFLFAERLIRFDCPRAMLVSAPGDLIPYLLFPETAIVSIVVQTADGHSGEAGLVGREGFVTSAIMLGTDRVPHKVEIQVAGHGYRIEVPDFVAAISQSDTMRATFLRFAHTLNVQSTFTAMSNATQPVEERLARWLLMCHDRSASDELYLTHQFMSVMLSVRRASVTTALHVLEGNQFIRGERGYVMMLNRKALEEFAGDAYGGPEAEYRRLLGNI
jgi:CRP-like cAMP-binding protein